LGDLLRKGLRGALRVPWGGPLGIILVSALRVSWGGPLRIVLVSALRVSWGGPLRVVLGNVALKVGLGVALRGSSGTHLIVARGVSSISSRTIIFILIFL